MAFNKYYSGSFVSRKNHIIKVDILKDAAAPASVGELSFPADSPLTVEWSADSKMETIHGSTATLTVISPGDRTYIDMYTAEVGSVRMDVYRDNALWWRGTLDTEFYEEPFISNMDYDVVMTFSDFGTLERLKYNIDTDVPTLHAIVGNALGRLQLGTTYELMTSTGLSAGATMALSDISIRSDNFTDEDGEVSNMEDVIKGILEPLGLHMRQWAGKVYIYDDNALSKTTSERITWESDDQTLGVDEVANSATVTFSPYAANELVKEGVFGLDFTPDGTKENLTTEGRTDMKGGVTYYYHTWYIDNLDSHQVSGNWDSSYIGFNLDLVEGSAHAKGMVISAPCLGHFEGYGNGDTCDAVIQYVRKNTHVNASVGGYGSKFAYTTRLNHQALITMPKTFIPAIPSSGQYYMKLNLPLLLSVSYNPFSGESEGEAGNEEKFKKRAGYVFVPFRARLKDADGNVLYHYTNGDIKTEIIPTMKLTKGHWEQGDYDDSLTSVTASAWLAYYSWEDRKTENGVSGGWSSNKQFCNINKRDNYESFKSLDEGQFMELPPVAGSLEIIIERGVYIYDWGNSGSTDTTMLQPVVSTTQELYGMITWHAYRQPTLGLVSYVGGKIFDVEVDDIEYKGTLLASAKDDMSVDTICGTATSQLLGARGQYIKASDGSQITVMYREGRGTTAEQLLIGTYHSHYASRHAKLSGTCRLSNGTGLTVFDDEVLQLPMVMTSATVDLIADECECTLIETNSDNYEDI